MKSFQTTCFHDFFTQTLPSSLFSEPAPTSILYSQGGNPRLFPDDSLSFTVHLIHHHLLYTEAPKWSSESSSYCFHDHRPRPSLYLCHLGYLRCHSNHATSFAEACKGLSIALRIKTNCSTWVDGCTRFGSFPFFPNSFNSSFFLVLPAALAFPQFFQLTQFPFLPQVPFTPSYLCLKYFLPS